MIMLPRWRNVELEAARVTDLQHTDEIEVLKRKLNLGEQKKVVV